MLVAKIELKSGVERWTFGGKHLCLDLRADDLAKRPSRLDTDMAAGQLRNENQNFGTIFQSCVSKIQHNDGRRARSINRDHFDPDGWERDLSENALSVTPITYQNC